MSHSRLRWVALLFWLFAVIQLDSLRDLPGRIARHHAGLFAPWSEYFSAGIALIAAVFYSALWLRSRKTQLMNKAG